jgi:hypothetical protein
MIFSKKKDRVPFYRCLSPQESTVVQLLPLRVETVLRLSSGFMMIISPDSIDRPPVNLHGTSDLMNLPVFHDHDLRPHGYGFRLIMGDVTCNKDSPILAT